MDQPQTSLPYSGANSVRFGRSRRPVPGHLRPALGELSQADFASGSDNSGQDSAELTLFSRVLATCGQHQVNFDPRWPIWARFRRTFGPHRLQKGHTRQRFARVGRIGPTAALTWPTSARVGRVWADCRLSKQHVLNFWTRFRQLVGNSGARWVRRGGVPGCAASKSSAFFGKMICIVILGP